jgi:hypothetical protein
MARNVSLQILRGVQANIQSAMPLALGEMYFSTDTGNLFFGTPGVGVGYIQLGDTTKVNETLQEISILLESIRRVLVVIACDGGHGAKAEDFEPAAIAVELSGSDTSSILS